ASHVSAHRLSGGMTNCLYAIAINPATTVPAEKQQDETTRMPRKYLLRIYGAGADEFVSRDKELYWLKQLASRRFGPQVYGVFGNGRLEEFLESTALTEGDIRNASTSKQIAQRLCEIHTQVGHHRPFGGSSERQNSTEIATHLSGKPDLWANIDAWMELIHNKWTEIRRKCNGNVECTEILDNWHRVEQGISKLKTCIEKDVHSPIVFSHNDLQYCNILRLKNTNELVIIDYEFSGYNYRGFDIANHFCMWMPCSSHSEHPHFLDLARYPTAEQRHIFLHAYIQAKALMDANASVVGPISAQLAERCTTRLTEDQIREEVAALDREVASFAAAPFLQWGIFGLLRSCSSDTGFDYVGFSAQRLSLFLSYVADLK
ncbi:hypothetical protein LPJ59_005088, partial [Coemansia sp. RSA 2399]